MLLFVIFILSIAITSYYFTRKKVKFALLANAIFLSTSSFFLLLILIKQIIYLIIFFKFSCIAYLQLILKSLIITCFFCFVLKIFIIGAIVIIIKKLTVFILKYFYKLKANFFSSKNYKEDNYIWKNKILIFKTNNKKLFLMNCKLIS